ncbi:hypothetical protein [Clostridium aminobutyricum]|uniref:Uncharacterized protein n=1 Tax=Clostridium aminobutyricum TaxID=33953 RepID=A0A939DAV3_CLOAM|nr:hypothetical protein [Clostridium aminobutyricum]MBN7773918.1 hypothetical protein [Clostridium aminobutyricum]
MENNELFRDTENRSEQSAQNSVANQKSINTNVVTMGQWLLFWLMGLINLIPVIGNIAYIVLIAVGAFGMKGKLPESLRNFCKAYLVLLAVVIVLFLAFAGSLLGTMAGMAGGF